MFNLRRIKGLKSLGGDYLGITSGNLIEARDNDPLINKLLPETVKFVPLTMPAYRGRRRRLTLLSYTGLCLILMKNSKSVMGTHQVQLYAFKNIGPEQDIDLLFDARVLASYRWPSGLLFITKATLKKMNEKMPSMLLVSGWRDLRLESGDRAFEILLPKPRIQ